ncbi:ankyrin [Penicillium malachiteum]|nr:ankyrin [Penicillium malachiteum]
MSNIVSRNDVAALRLYHLSSQTRVFWEGYEIRSWHPLFVAQEHDSFDALRVLLEIYLTESTYTERLDYAANGLRRAYSNGDEKLSEHEEFICFLLDQGCSVPDSNIYVEQCAEGTKNANRPSELKNTVLAAAISHASYKIVSRLIAEGADVHARESWSEYSTYGRPDRPRNSKGLTALHIASLFRNVEGIQALMDHCGDKTLVEMCSIEDNNGQIPLHWALLGAIYEPKIFK